MSNGLFDFRALLSPFLREEARGVAIGVSGGADSMALCYALSQYSEVPVHVLTVDHGLRSEAGLEALQVEKWVSDWPQVRHVILKRELSQKPLAKIQEEARHDRYQLLADYCAENNIGQLFVAHHMDDQAETFLFRLAKGSGLDGLGAMRPVYDYSDDLQIIRPFLDVPKNELVDFCAAHNIGFIKDPSNDDTRFARVRLRGAYEVLAEEGLTPKRLAVTASRLARARDALDFYAENVLDQALLFSEPNRIVFDLKVFSSAPDEVRLRGLAKAMDMVREKQNYGPRMERMEALARRLFAEPDFRKSSLGGCLVGLDHKTGQVTVEREKNNAS